MATTLFTTLYDCAFLLAAHGNEAQWKQNIISIKNLNANILLSYIIPYVSLLIYIALFYVYASCWQFRSLRVDLLREGEASKKFKKRNEAAET